MAVTNYSGYNPNPYAGPTGATWTNSNGTITQYRPGIGTVTISGPSGGAPVSAPTATASATPTGTTQQQQTQTVDPAASYYDWLKKQEEDRVRRSQDSLIATMREFMAANGMTELLAAVEKYVRMGYSGDAVYVMVKNDPQYQAAYNTRFAANAERAKAGLPELSPATYVEMEQGYRSVMMAAGFPAGLFDQASDFTSLIARDVSVEEVGRRVGSALDYINYSGNANVRQQLRDLYGLSDAQMAAYVLDPTRTLDFLEREMGNNLRRASVGGAAQTVGVGLSGNLRDQIAEVYGGASGDQVFADTTARFTDVATQAPLYQRLAAYSGEVGTTDELVQEEFSLSGASEVTNKKKTLASQERARFSGMSGLGSTSLSAGRRAQ